MRYQATLGIAAINFHQEINASADAETVWAARCLDQASQWPMARNIGRATYPRRVERSVPVNRWRATPAQTRRPVQGAPGRDPRSRVRYLYPADPPGTGC